MGKRTILLILAGCIFLGGCALLAYPKVSQWLNGLHQSEVIADYSSAVDGLNDEDAKKELQRAANYNRELTDMVSLTDPFENKLAENDQYPTLLNFTAEGVMGYIEIPKISVLLPIYHGVSSGVLSKGIGHLPETSLPVGGASTHCVLAGHSGMRFEQLRAQFQFLNENGIATEADMNAFVEKAEAQIKTLTKQRTILNVQKKKRQPLFQALTGEEALAPAKRLYDQGHSGMEAEAQQYMDAVKLLDSCGESREALSQQQSEIYTKLADLNREIRQVRKQIKMCEEIRAQAATMQDNIQQIEHPEKEAMNHDKQR